MTMIKWSYVVQEGAGGCFQYGVTFRDHQQAAEYFNLTTGFQKGMVTINLDTGACIIFRQPPTDDQFHYLEMVELDRLDLDQIWKGCKRVLALHYFTGEATLHDTLIRGELLRTGLVSTYRD